MLPEQVAKYMTPLHMGLELLPLGLFQRHHANHLAMVINLIAVDSAGRGNGMWEVADRAGEVLQRMFARVKDGKQWNVTVEERRVLREVILQLDRYMRTWTTNRLLVAATTCDEVSNKAKAAGGQFLDRVEIPGGK